MANKTTPQRVGKIFEEDFSKSMDKYMNGTRFWHKRLNDGASVWSGGRNSRFTPTNECDMLMFDLINRNLYGFELKSVKERNSLTFWREDFEKVKKSGYHIKKNQILGLKKWADLGLECGIVFNFRTEKNDTYYVPIQNFIDYTSELNKKSISQKDVEKMKPIKIKCLKKKTRYTYNITSFVLEINHMIIERMKRK